MNSFFNLLLFVIWPFGGFIYNLTRPINRVTYLIFILFFFLIGCSFDFHDPSVDSYRYAEEFVEMPRHNFYTSFLYQIAVSGRIDIYYSMVAISVGRVTHNPHILYGIFASIFGFFVCKMFTYFKRDWNAKCNCYIFVILLSIFTLNPQTNINGVRYWTTVWLFATSVIAYFLYDRKKWIIGILLSPIMHSSFVICLPIVFFIKVLKKHRKTLFIIGIISFCVGILGVNDYLLKYIPSNLFIFSHYQTYLEEGYMSEIAELKAERHFITILIGQLRMFLCALILYSSYRQWDKIDEKSRALLVICISLFSVSMLLSFIPSMGRFLTLVYMLTFYLLFRYYSIFRNKVASIYIILSFPLLVHIIYQDYLTHLLVLNSIYLRGSIIDIINFALYSKS